MRNYKKHKSKKLKAQGVIEYTLVFVFAAIVMYAFAQRIDIAKLRTFAIPGFIRPEMPRQLVVPPMSD